MWYGYSVDKLVPQQSDSDPARIRDCVEAPGSKVGMLGKIVTFQIRKVESETKTWRVGGLDISPRPFVAGISCYPI